MFQYYEMSYGLNVEMHKQVSNKNLSGVLIRTEYCVDTTYAYEPSILLLRFT